MKTVYISLGSNLGDRISTIEEAYKRINLSCGRIVKKSSFYETPPWGFESDQFFLNSVIELETALPLPELLICLKNIEKSMGRNPRKEMAVYEDRLIDLDIIDYDQQVFESENLKVPHDKMHLRNFVVIPLAEIASEWTHPKYCKSITYYLESFENSGVIKRLKN